MFKLLTEETRKKVAHEYMLRRLIVAFLALDVVLVIGIIGLMPSYVLSDVRQVEVSERSRILDATGNISDNSELQAWLTRANLQLALLAPQPNVRKPSEVMGNLLSQDTVGISLTTFFWVKVDDEILLQVEGMADNRQALINFENNVSASGHFSDVSLPVSNLAKDSDINFQVTLTPSPTGQTP